MACVLALVVVADLGARPGSGAPPLAVATGAPGPATGRTDSTGPVTEDPPAEDPPAPPVTSAESGHVPADRKVRVRDHGSGSFHRAALSVPSTARTGRLLRYAVEIEKGLPFDRASTARAIARTLNDRRGWTDSGDWRFQLVGTSRRVDFTILIATPDTTDRLCWPMLTRGRVSCQNGNLVVLNARRWAYGASTYGEHVASYRKYLVNHEVGHRLGRGHVGCPRHGGRAPVMMQQTKGLQGCRPNPWP